MVASNTEYFMSDMDDKTHCFYISFDLDDDGEFIKKLTTGQKISLMTLQILRLENQKH